MHTYTIDQIGNWFALVHAQEMAELNQRTAAVSALRRQAAAIMDEEFQEDAFECQQRSVTVQNHFDRFTTAHDVLVGQADDDEALAAHQALWEEMEDLYNPVIVKLNRLMAHVNEPPASEDRDSNQNAMMDLKLEPVRVPKFDGSLRNWLSFKDAIETILNVPEIPEYYKLSKLRDAMSSESLKTLVGNLYTGGFDATWKELIRRYDNPRQLAELHVSRFVGIKPASTETAANLLTIVDTVRESLRALRVMELPVDQWDALSVPIITSKLPQATQHAWGMHSDQKAIPKLDDLLEFVEKRAQSLSLDILHWPGAPSTGAAGGTLQRGGPSNSSRRLVKSNLAATTPGHCTFCNEPAHTLTRCPKLLALTPGQRFSSLRGSDLCFNCLKPGHPTKECSSSGRCRTCDGRHHTLLCRKEPTNAQSQASSTTNTSSSVPAGANASATAPSGSQPPRNFT